MIKTISNPDFAGRIISRHTTLLSVTQSSAELLFPRSREHNEGGNRFSKSIRNIYFLSQLTNENNIFNIHLNLRFLSGIVSKTVREISESATRHIHMLEKTFTAGHGDPRQTQQVSLDRPAIYTGEAPVFLRHRQLEAGSEKAKDKSGSPNMAPAIDKPPQKETPGLIKSLTTKNHALVATKTIVQWEQERVQVIPVEHGALRLPSPEVTGARLLSVLLSANRSVPVWHRRLWDQPSDIPGYSIHVNVARLQREISEQDDSVSALSRLILPAARLLPETTVTNQQSWTRGEINTTQPQAMRAKDIKSHQAKAQQKREPGTNTTRVTTNTTPSAQIHPAYTVYLPQTEHSIWPESASKAHIRLSKKDSLQTPGVGIDELKNRLSHPAMMRKTQVKHNVPQVSQAEEKSISPITWQHTIPTKMMPPREDSATIAGQMQNAPKKDFPYADYPQKIQRIFLSAIPMLNTSVRNSAASAINALFPLESGEPSSAYRQPKYVLPAHSPKQADGMMLQIPIPNRTAKPPVYATPPAAQETPAQASGYSLPDYMQNLTYAAKFTASGIREAEAPAHRAMQWANRHAGRQTAYNAPAAIIYKKETQRENPAQQVSEPVKFSEDIEFIKKSVKQTVATTQTVRANTAVNTPGTVTSPQGATLGIDQQVSVIADKVYNALERRLRSERMRKGLL